MNFTAGQNTIKVNVLLIGVGYYARRTYVPAFNKQWSDIKLACGLDLSSQMDLINSYLFENNNPFPVYFTSDSALSKKVSCSLEHLLDFIIEKHKINAVIISTEPLSHFKYAKWAISRKLHVLMDKPITTELGVVSSLEKAQNLLDDYQELKNDYLCQRSTCSDLVFSLMAQRRYHPAFNFVNQMIDEIKQETRCPITSVQMFNSDGQWRFPTEIIEQNYHPYNQGYGKGSHSGYHFLDIVSWLIFNGYPNDKKPDNLELSSQAVFPNDLIAQFTLKDYEQLFPDFNNHNKYSELEYKQLCQDFGEVDVFTNLSLKKGSSTLTLCNINLLHNGSSQRNWVTANGKDLYKGNGRIKHESYYLLQGPFQAVLMEAYQSLEDHDVQPENPYDFGGKCHLDVHVFRNSKMFPHYKPHKKFTALDISEKLKSGLTSGIQEESRQSCIDEFINNILKPKPISQHVSNLVNHEIGVTLLSLIYRSLVLRKIGQNPYILHKL